MLEDKGSLKVMSDVKGSLKVISDDKGSVNDTDPRIKALREAFAEYLKVVSNPMILYLPDLSYTFII